MINFNTILESRLSSNSISQNQLIDENFTPITYTILIIVTFHSL